MKCVLSLSLLVLAAGAVFAQQQTIKVSDVVDMAHAGLPDDLIVAKLHKANQPFDLTPQEMVDLKKAGVSDNVIKVMIDPSAQGPAVVVAPGVGVAGARASGATPTAGTSEAAIEANMNNPDAPHDSGIYVYTTNRDNKKVMVGLERASYQGTKGNFLAHSMTYGIAKAKNRAVIPGPHASIRVSDPRPEFYFYFEDKSAALGKSNSFGGQTVSNPNQFALVKLEANKNNRETVVGTVGFGSTNTGTDTKAMVAFKADKLRPGVYKVVPTTNMEPGEYAFVGGGTAPVGMTGAAASAMDIFDFAILSAQ